MVLVLMYIFLLDGPQMAWSFKRLVNKIRTKKPDIHPKHLLYLRIPGLILLWNGNTRQIQITRVRSCHIFLFIRVHIILKLLQKQHGHMNSVYLLNISAIVFISMLVVSVHLLWTNFRFYNARCMKSCSVCRCAEIIHISVLPTWKVLETWKLPLYQERSKASELCLVYMRCQWNNLLKKIAHIG